MCDSRFEVPGECSRPQGLSHSLFGPRAAATTNTAPHGGSCEAMNELLFFFGAHPIGRSMFRLFPYTKVASGREC